MPEFVEPHPLSSKKKKSLYVINLHLRHPDYDGPFYAIYAVPLPEIEIDSADPGLAPPSAPAPLPLSPAVTLAPPHYPRQLGFGVIGSSIYVIGGQRDDLSPSLDVYIIDTTRIPPGTSPSRDPNRSLYPFMAKGPPLTTRMRCPIVVSLLGKIFAIPPYFTRLKGWQVQYLRSSSRRWRTVPDPEFSSKYASSALPSTVQSCTVIGSLIVVLIGDFLVVELDGKYPARGWQLSSEFTYFTRLRWGLVSQVVEDFLFPSRGLSQIRDKGCLEAVDLLAQREPNPKPVDLESIPHPSNGKLGGGLVDATRIVVDIGEGLCLIMTQGFEDRCRAYVRKKGVLRCAFDVVRLKPETIKKRKKHSTSPPARTLSCVILKSVNYVTGEFKKEGHGILCGCLPVGVTSSDTGYIAWYWTDCIRYWTDDRYC